MSEAIEAKIKNCRFIHEEYLDWLTNVVPFMKKNGKVRACIKFIDLNDTCPKDEFSLPTMDAIINNTCGSKDCPSWMGFPSIIK